MPTKVTREGDKAKGKRRPSHQGPRAFSDFESAFLGEWKRLVALGKQAPLAALAERGLAELDAVRSPNEDPLRCAVWAWWRYCWRLPSGATPSIGVLDGKLVAKETLTPSHADLRRLASLSTGCAALADVLEQFAADGAPGFYVSGAPVGEEHETSTQVVGREAHALAGQLKALANKLTARVAVKQPLTLLRAAGLRRAGEAPAHEVGAQGCHARSRPDREVVVPLAQREHRHPHRLSVGRSRARRGPAQRG